MMLYRVFLWLTLFGCACGAINASGIFSYHAPVQSSVGITEGQITDLTNQSTGPLSPLMELNGLSMLLKFLSGAIAGIMIIPLGLQWGIPLWIIMMFQTPLWLVEAVGLYQLWTGRDIEGN